MFSNFAIARTDKFTIFPNTSVPHRAIGIGISTLAVVRIVPELAYILIAIGIGISGDYDVLLLKTNELGHI